MRSKLASIVSALLCAGCPQPPPPTGPAAETAPEPAPAVIRPLPPVVEAVTSERVAAALSYRGSLVVADADAPSETDELVAGKGLWHRTLSIGAVPLVHVFACEGLCRMPFADRMRAATPFAVTSRKASLPDGRAVTMQVFGAGLGGWAGLARLPTPEDRHEVIVMIECAPKDVPVPDEARALCREHDAMDLAESVARALDPVVFRR